VAVLLGAAGLALILGGAVRSPAEVGAPVRLVVSARALDAGSVLGPGDVAEVQAGASDALGALAHSASDVVGRRLAVAVPSGAPLGAMLLADGASVPSGHRLVRVPVDAAALPPDVGAGAVVDVLAALVDPPGGGRVVSVAHARVVAVSGGASPVVTLDLDGAGASRLIWAQTFAKSLRLLARSSAGDESPPDVAGLGR
jgi:hypothetical protein